MTDFNQTATATSSPLIMEQDPDFPYLPHSMKCKPIIDCTTLCFHNNTIPHPIKIFSDEDSEYKFGILNITIRSEIPINRKHIHMFFTIDASSSMSDVCSDGRTKMAHIHHTLENMLRIFYENHDCNISVHVQSFNTDIQPVVNNVPNIHDADIEELIVLISRKIKPSGSTNIELALEKASQEINMYHTTNYDHEIVHIFLTDGDITSGSRDYSHLLELVPKKCTNIFIGYGLDHDSNLLSHLSIKKGDEYRFVDALEKAGLVYGEVIHSILYKAIEDVTLSATNAEIYNYQTNTWSTYLEIGNLLSEQTKTFHVRTKNLDECYISINGKTIVKTRQFQTINIYEKQTDIWYKFNSLLSETKNLEVYLFRQKTQELLYESRKISEQYKKAHIYDPMSYIDEHTEVETMVDSLKQQQKTLKEKMKEFHKTMINYMKDKNIENNPMMKMLCDDIYIAYKTTGTKLGTMYTCARQTSNGRQQTYMCSATHTQEIYGDNKKPRRLLRLQRPTNVPSVEFSQTTQVFAFDTTMSPIDHKLNNENDIDNYAPSQDFLSPFSSEGVVTLMREVSGNPSIGRTLADEDNDDDEHEEKTNSGNKK